MFSHFPLPGWYSSGSFYVVQCLADTLLVIATLLVYVYILNIYEDIRPGTYWTLTSIIIVAAIGYQGLGHLLCLLSKRSLPNMVIMCVAVFLVHMIHSSFFVPEHKLHYVFQITAKLSWFKYVIDLTLLQLFGFGRCGHRQVNVVLYRSHLMDEDFYSLFIQMTLLTIAMRVVALIVYLKMMNPVENRREREHRIGQVEHKIVQAIIPGMSSHHQFRIKTVQF